MWEANVYKTEGSPRSYPQKKTKTLKCIQRYTNMGLAHCRRSKILKPGPQNILRLCVVISYPLDVDGDDTVYIPFPELALSITN